MNEPTYRVAILHSDGVWRFSPRQAVPESLLQSELELFAAHEIAANRLFVVEARDEEGFEKGLATLNAAPLRERFPVPPLDFNGVPDEWNIAKHMQKLGVKPTRGREKRTEKQEIVWHAMENSTAPVKDERYVYRSPVDWTEYRKWMRLHEKHQQGGICLGA